VRDIAVVKFESFWLSKNDHQISDSKMETIGAISKLFFV
jgi:hypothetical protein